ncbi:MAG: hypothetical protein ACRD5L_04155, partial [Bryobacteraceae bacterium]
MILNELQNVSPQERQPLKLKPFLLILITRNSYQYQNTADRATELRRRDCFEGGPQFEAHIPQMRVGRKRRGYVNSAGTICQQITYQVFEWPFRMHGKAQSPGCKEVSSVGLLEAGEFFLGIE